MTDTDSASGSGTPSTGQPPQAAGKGGELTERLTVPWWYWPLPLVAAVLLAAEVHMGYPGVRAWLPYLITVPLTVWMLVGMGRIKVGVSDGELRVGDAHIPLRHIGKVEVLDATEKRVALGRELDPAAFVMHRGWVQKVIRVELIDPQDPTPYWVFSARSGERLAALLRQGG